MGKISLYYEIIAENSQKNGNVLIEVGP